MPPRDCPDPSGSVACAALRREELEGLFLPYDLKRLEMYSRNMVDYHLIMDMIPAISRMYFLNQLGDLALSAAQSVGHLLLVCWERGWVCRARVSGWMFGWLFGHNFVHLILMGGWREVSPGHTRGHMGSDVEACAWSCS